MAGTAEAVSSSPPHAATASEATSRAAHSSERGIVKTP